MRVPLNNILPDPCSIARHGRTIESVSLLTFSPGEEAIHLPSAVVRFLKDSRIPEESPSGPAAALAAALGGEAARRAAGEGITAVCRVLSSRETVPLPDSPLEAAARAAADALGARVCHPAFRTAPRPPMSAVPRLSGRDAFPERIRYASRDLVVCEWLRGERVLLLDDIRCTGASEAVWGWALTELAGAESVSAISLAQAEGMDPDHPVAEIELEAIRREARTAAGPYRKAFDVAWLEPGRRLLHLRKDCRLIAGEAVLWWRAAGKGTRDCPACRHPVRDILVRLRRRF